MHDIRHRVGKRRVKPLTFHATAENLMEGCRFNDALHALPTGRMLHMRKGVYHFRTHEKADAHRTESLIMGIAASGRHR